MTGLGVDGDAMRLDRVEIKVSLEGGQTRSAVRALDLPEGPKWQIYFCEDVTSGTSPGTPLLDLGVILRARQKPDGKDDTTVKLRPCRRSQLSDAWLAARSGEDDAGEDWDVKLEADWSGDRRVLAVSCSADRPEGVVAAAGRGDGGVGELFQAKQVAFLQDCAGVRVNLATLTVLPPVTATRWKEVEAAPPGLDARAERWTVDDLDFLELSVVADLGDAPTRQVALTRFVGDLGLEVDEAGASKTQQVLRRLVERVAPPSEEVPMTPERIGNRRSGRSVRGV